MNSKKVSGFKNLISSQELIKYLESVSIQKPTQVQKDCIPPLLGEGDFTVQGKTGSGKTLGFLLPLIQKLKEAEKQRTKDILPATPAAIILLPTRELALQVFGIAKEISHFAKLRVRKLVGGDKGKSLESLYRSKIDVLVTTPDRCLKSFQKKELTSGELKFFIFDEADQLLEPSFKKTVSEIAKKVINEATQVFLISASRPPQFPDIISDFFPKRNFGLIGKGEENVLNHQVKAYNVALEEADKFVYVKSFLKKQEKRNGIIFTGNKARAKKVFQVFQEEGLKKIFLLHKDLEIKERVKVVEDFRKKGGVMIATDIFARGIDIPHLQWVLNFDLPSEPDYYLHRSGRVGRAGKTGDVFNFITSKDITRQRKINQALINQGRYDLKLPSLKPSKK